MNSETFKKIEEIYHAALDVDPERRSAFLENACSGEDELRKKVEELLRFEDESGDAIAGSFGALAAEIVARDTAPGSSPPKNIGRYQVERVLGEGGMGTVYLAQDPRLARPVALKVLSSDVVRDENRVHRFMHEARAASALNHPHILTVYALGEETGEDGAVIHFISMEYVDGETLDRLIYSGSNVFPYLVQVAKGLAKAHSAGIVHRDLKPENIMVSRDGYAKILDFGLAKLTDSDNALHELQQHRSRSGVILGTLGYMSPEQAQGKKDIDHRSDIFAFGCILYEALAKRKAFEADTAIDCLHKIVHEQPAALREIDPGIPEDLSDLVETCLRKDPGERSLGTSEIASILESLHLREEPPARAVSSPQARTMIREGDSTRESRSLSFSGQRRQVTAMFLDSAAIAEMLEDLDPEESLEIVNELWSLLDEMIVESAGKIGERLADTGLAVWGSDRVTESDPETAVRTALGLQRRTLEYFKESLSSKLSLPPDELEAIGPAGLLRIGISTGTVLVGNSSDTGEFMTTGTAVNTAKRLLSKTAPGDIFISHDTYRHIRGIFKVEEVTGDGAFGLGLKKQETRTFSIKGIKPKAFRMETRGVEGIETPLIGREAELIRLRGMLDAVAEDRELQVVTIAGEAGLGKSRLLFEFHDLLDLSPDKYYVFTARALESMRATPFSLVRELFSFRFGIHEADSAEDARDKFTAGILELTADTRGEFDDPANAGMKAAFLGHLIGFDFSESEFLRDIVEDEEQIQDRALVYACQLFEAVSRVHPSVFYLDDLHWADDESLNFFDRVARECEGSAMLIIELTRPLLFERRPHRGEGLENRIRLDLQPLTKRESGKLVESILQKAKVIPDELVELLVANTEGNPFYVEELVKMLVEQSVISSEGESWVVDSARLGEVSVPSTLTGVLQSRLDSLSTWEMRILQRASVIGRDFWDTALSGFENEVSVPTVLDSLRRKELLYRKERSSVDGSVEYIFKHALLRDVTYETLLNDERRKWHIATAEWLIESRARRQNEYMALIAEHFEKGDEYLQAARWYGRAGEQGQKSNSLETAETLFLKALKLKDDLAGTEFEDIDLFEVLGWKRSLGMIYSAQAKFKESIRMFDEILSSARDAGSKLWQAEAYWGLSISQFDIGDNRSSLESAQKAVNLASECENDDPEDAALLQAKGMFRQGRSLISLGRFDEAISIAENSVKRLDEVGASASSQKANALHLLAAANMFLGRLGRAQEYELQEVRLARGIGDLRTLANGLNSLGFQAYLQGDGKKAIGYYNESLEMAREIGNRSSQIMVGSNICGTKVILGDYASAEEGLRDQIGGIADKGHFLLPEMYRFLTESLIGQGRLDEAFDAAKLSLSLSEKNENQETIGEAWRVLGVISSMLGSDIGIAGKQFSADDCFETALRAFEELGMEANLAQTLDNFSRHSAASGDLRRSEELLAREKEISQRLELDTAAKSPYFIHRNQAP